MTTTRNIEISNAWSAVAGEGEVLVTATNPIERVEWAIAETGTPAETMRGHYIDRRGDQAMTLNATEILYLRVKGNGFQTAVLTAKTPLAAAI